MKIETILVPTDFSPHAEHALDYAVGLAKTFGARLHLLHAYSLPVPATFPDTIAVPQSVWDGLREYAGEQLAEARKRVVANGVECEVEALGEPPFPAVVETAERIRADLIVMGTRGLTGLKHVVLGSVAERTVRLAPCPVITVKDQKA